MRVSHVSKRGVTATMLVVCSPINPTRLVSTCSSVLRVRVLKPSHDKRKNISQNVFSIDSNYGRYFSSAFLFVAQRVCREKILSLIHISEPTRPLYISYAVFCLKKKILLGGRGDGAPWPQIFSRHTLCATNKKADEK